MSIWDTFVREPGKIADNSTGDDACKSYEKYLEDVQLMKNLNVRNAKQNFVTCTVPTDRNKFPHLIIPMIFIVRIFR